MAKMSHTGYYKFFLGNKMTNVKTQYVQNASTAQCHQLHGKRSSSVEKVFS